MENFKSIIKKWVELDNEINKNKNKNKILEKNKKTLDLKIINFIKNRNLQNTKFKLNDNTKIIYKESVSTSGITQKLLKKSLEDFFLKNKFLNMDTMTSTKLVESLYNFILQQRNSKTNYNIKRVKE